MMTPNEFAIQLRALGAETGHMVESAIHAARQILRVAEEGSALQARISHLLSELAVDGSAHVPDVRQASDESPQAQEGGAAVTGVEGSHPETSGVGNGSADRGGPALSQGDCFPTQAEQVPHGDDAGSPTSNPDPASSPEARERDLATTIMNRTPSPRNQTIELWHQTRYSIEQIAGMTALSAEHVLKYLSNARERLDARVLRGDDARAMKVEA